MQVAIFDCNSYEVGSYASEAGWAAQHNEVVQVAIFDCNSYEVGSYASEAGWAATLTIKDCYQPKVGSQSKIATNLLTFGDRLLRAEGRFRSLWRSRK